MPGKGGVGLKKVESIRQSIIEKRNRLGWSDKILAKKSNVPYIVIRRMLEGSRCLDGYISQINSSLDEAIKSLPAIEKEQKQTQLQFYTPINENDSIKRNPFRKRGGWALHHS